MIYPDVIGKTLPHYSGADAVDCCTIAQRSTCVVAKKFLLTAAQPTSSNCGTAQYVLLTQPRDSVHLQQCLGCRYYPGPLSADVGSTRTPSRHDTQHHSFHCTGFMAARSPLIVIIASSLVDIVVAAVFHSKLYISSGGVLSFAIITRRMLASHVSGIPSISHADYDMKRAGHSMAGACCRNRPSPNPAASFLSCYTK